MHLHWVHFIIPTVHLLIGAVLSFLQLTVKTAAAHRPEMSLQFDGSSSVVFFFCCFSPAGKRPTGKFIYLWNILIHINLHIQYYFTFVERVGLNCYFLCPPFLIPPLPLHRQNDGRWGWKVSIGPHSNFRWFWVRHRGISSALRFGTLSVFVQSALKKVSEVEVRDFRHTKGSPDLHRKSGSPIQEFTMTDTGS